MCVCVLGVKPGPNLLPHTHTTKPTTNTGLLAIGGARLSQGGGVSPIEALVAVPLTVAGWVVQVSVLWCQNRPRRRTHMSIGANPKPCSFLSSTLQEWAIHRHLLHGSLQWPGSSIHQQHHELPFYHVSIDPPVIVLAWGAVACALALALLPQPMAWTVLGVRSYACLVCLYVRVCVCVSHVCVSLC